MTRFSSWRRRLPLALLVVVLLIAVSGILLQQGVLAAAIAPAAPEDLTGVFSNPASGPQIKLNWDDMSYNEVGFVVVRANDNQFTQGLKSWMTGPDVTSLVDDTIQPVGTYYYRIESFNAIDVSAWAPDASGLQVTITSTSHSQGWKLTNTIVNGIAYWMEKGGTQTGQVDMLPGESRIWLSGEAAASPVTFLAGKWEVHLETVGWSGNCGVQIGESSGEVLDNEMNFNAFNDPEVIGTPDLMPGYSPQVLLRLPED